MGMMTGFVGFCMLILGRQFYGVFSGGVIFIMGISLLPYLALSGDSQGQITFSVFMSLLAGLSSFSLKRIVVGITGFFAGAGLVFFIPALLGWDTSWLSLPVCIAAGMLSVAMLLVAFDYALILFSSLAGSTIILQALPVWSFDRHLVFFLVFLFGMITQFVMLGYGKPAPD
jgi:hypothetical protein